MSENEKDASLPSSALDHGDCWGGGRILRLVCIEIESPIVTTESIRFYSGHELTRPWRAHHHLAPVTSFDLPLLLVPFRLSFEADIHQDTNQPVVAAMTSTVVVSPSGH